MKKVKNKLLLFNLELCCTYCFYKDFHKNHKIIYISDIKSLEKENITLEYSTKEFNEIVQNIIHLKETIENEIIKINNLYEKTIDELINKARKRYKRKITK